ncbi:MAG: ferritin-like domain-containing protein [Caldilineaceae bacterium]
MLKRYWSRRRFLQSLTLVGGWSLIQPQILHKQQTPPRVPSISSATCPATPAELLNLAATLEALTTTFYYTAITTNDGFFAALPTAYQRYLRVTLAAEWGHYRHLVDTAAATPRETTFYFPVTLFAAGSFASFLTTLDLLESSAIAFYLAAIRQLADLNEPELAIHCGQIAGVEAEHRVMGREMAQDNPPAPNNLCYERALFLCATEVNAVIANFTTAGADLSGPITLPIQAEIDAAVGEFSCEAASPATVDNCPETLAVIVDTAAIAEALAVTFYYHAIQSDLFAHLSAPQQWYLQAALDEERHHLVMLREQGATLPPDHFFFPADLFTDLAALLALLDTLENAFISAYLAAIPRLQALGEPLLAEIAGQILGVECEHRALGRVLANAQLPHNRCMTPAFYHCIGEAATALQPFVTGDATLTQSKPRPTELEIDTAVARFGCTPVPLARLPDNVYLPLIIQ